MRQCSLLCVRWWPLIFIGVPILFMLPLLAFKWRFIESDVAFNTVSDLQAAQANWAHVETRNRGRHVLITGSPPNKDAIEQARSLAKSSYGVDKVTISANVKAPLKFASLSATVVDQKLKLSGELSSKEELDYLLKQAQNAFGKLNVDNQLTVKSDTQKLPPMGDPFKTLASTAPMAENLLLTVEENNMSIQGKAKTNDSKVNLETSLNKGIGSRFISSLDISAPPPIKRDVCQDSVNELLANSQINFESAKAIITSDSYELLANLKSTAERCPDANFEIAGHTDSSGNLSFNMSLSQARAKAVLDHLVNLGLRDTQFSATGYGPNKPIGDNNTSEGRAQNRRIEFKLKN